MRRWNVNCETVIRPICIDLSARKLKIFTVYTVIVYMYVLHLNKPGRVAQSVGHLTRRSEVMGSILGLATCFRFYFR